MAHPDPRDMTPNERTRKKNRQRKNRARRADAGAELAAVVERHFEELPGDVKRAFAHYRKVVTTGGTSA